MKKFSDFLEGRCWTGFKPVPGKKPYSPGSCVKESAAAAIAAATAIAKKKSGNYDEKGFRKTPYKNPNHPNRKSNTEREAELKEDLRKWFSKTDPAGGWKRINSKGEAIGPCAREPGEPKPKCMSNEKRASLTKKERASAVASKRKHDPNPERQGKPINVSNFGKGKISEDMENLDEKNVPTSPEKWAQAKSQAKAKFDVYPCVPLDSLAISKNGPISHDELNIGDEILTYNMNQDILEWKPITHKHYYEDAPLLEIGKPTGFSIRCTPNHKWVISKDGGNELVETKDLNTHMRILMCSILKNDSSLLIENWFKKDNWVEKVLSMNEKEREIFLASSVVYDGWDKGVSSKIKDRHTFGFCQKEYDHLWASLLAAYLNGYYVNSREKAEDMTSASYIRNKKYHNTQNLYKKDAGSEDVWCPTTENETWVMIQNGLITITGNSAYANGWASKKYKAMGGGWKSVSEDTGMTEGAVPAQEKIITVKHKTSGKTLRISAAAAAKYRMQGYHYHPVNEEKDEQEYGYEGDMALNQLATLTRCAEMIKDLLKPDTDMPEWVQSKITLATDYIQTAADYMYSEMKDMKEEVEQIDELSNATLRGYADKARTDIQKTLPKLHTDAKAAGRIDKRVAGLAASSVAKVKNNMKKEEVELDEADQKFIDSLNKLAKTHKVGDSVTVDSKFFGKQKGKVTKVDNQSVHVVRDGKKSAEKYPHNAVVKEASDNSGTVPTPAAETLTMNGQQKLNKTVGQTKMIPYVHENKETKPPFDKPYTTTKAVVKDKSGAKHTPMSRARDLARKAMARNMKEQSNVTPNPFTVPEIDIGKAPKKTKATMSESRQLEIVREAMKVAKKKKEVTEAGSDKFIADPELSSQITKSNP